MVKNITKSRGRAKKFKNDLREITSGNPKYKSEKQLYTVKKR